MLEPVAYVLTKYMFAGSVPTELCAVTSLEAISFENSSSLDNCYDTCLDNIPNVISGVIPVCGGYNAGLCDLIDAFDISQTDATWACSGGVPTTPCSWNGVSCNPSGEVSEIILDMSPFTGNICSLVHVGCYCVLLYLH